VEKGERWDENKGANGRGRGEDWCSSDMRGKERGKKTALTRAPREDNEHKEMRTEKA
jgi:hypothetical protein